MDGTKEIVVSEDGMQVEDGKAMYFYSAKVV